MAIIEVKKLTKSYMDGAQKNTIFKNFSMEVEAGKFATIIGRSGAGKSTLLNIIGGLDVPDSGEIIIGGKDICRMNDKELSDFRAKDVGFVFQDFNLIPVLSVWDNILLPIKISKRIVDQEYIEDVMKMLEIYEKKDTLPDKLSGGQKQRVAIARALANKPSVVLADEPTGNLDMETGEKVLELLLNGIRKYHQTLVMVTHNMDIAARADYTIQLNG